MNCTFPAAELLAYQCEMQAVANTGDYAAAEAVWRIEELRRAHFIQSLCYCWREAIKEAGK